MRLFVRDPAKLALAEQAFTKLAKEVIGVPLKRARDIPGDL